MSGTTPIASRPTLLIPIVFPDPDPYPLTDMDVEGLNGFDIVLFGYWQIEDGVSPTAARAAHETEAEAVLYETAAYFSHAGASTDIELHFGPAGTKESQLQDRIVAETDADGILIPKRFSMLNNVLVPLRDDRNVEEIVDFVSAFDPATIFVLELYHVAPDAAGVEDAKRMLERVERTLLDRGFTDSDIETTVDVGDQAGAAIVERARNHNVVVMGATEELDFEDRFLGPQFRYVAERTSTPIVVIR